MGVRESAGELEAAMSGMGRGAKPEAKANKSHEAAVPSQQGRMEDRIRNIESQIKNETGGLEKKISMMERRIESLQEKDFSADIEDLKQSVAAIRNSIASGGSSNGGESKAPAKDLLELKSRMDVLQKYVDGKLGMMQALQKSVADNKAAEEKIRSMENETERRMNELLKNIENESGRFVSRNDMEKILSDKIRGVPKASEINKAVDERIGARLAEFSSEEKDGMKDSMQHTMAGIKSGIDRHISDAARKMNDVANKIASDGENIKRELEERMAAMERNVVSKPDFEKRLAEIKIDEKMKEIGDKAESFRDDLAKEYDEKMKTLVPRADFQKFSKKVEELSRYDLDKLKSVAGAERMTEEKLKLFALNSDLDKVWKDLEGLKKYMDEKSKYAESLANSLHTWESRNMELAERERGFDEKLEAFPELKLMEGKLRKMERAIADLQRHFVAAQMMEPIIME